MRGCAKERVHVCVCIYSCVHECVHNLYYAGIPWTRHANSSDVAEVRMHDVAP